MGISNVRVPAQDLLDESIAQRVSDYQRAGIRFHVFGSITQIEALATQDEQVLNRFDSLELITTEEQDLSTLSIPEVFKQKKRLLGQATTGRDSESSQGLYFHSVSSGYRWPLSGEREAVILNWITDTKNTTIVFQLPWESDTSILLDINSWCQQHRANAMINIRSAKQNPAEMNSDDELIADRLLAILAMHKNAAIDRTTVGYVC